MASPSIAHPYRLTLVTSLAVHLLGAAALWAGAERAPSSASVDVRPPQPGASDKAFAALAAPTDGIAVDETSIDVIGPVPRSPAGDTVPHTDNGSPGRGGDTSARVQALNLADTDDRMRSSPDLLNRLDRDQIQRLSVSRARASWDDRRSTTHPAELALVAVGPGSVQERRPPSQEAPSLGVGDLLRAARRGAALEGSAASPSEDPEVAQRPGADRAGSKNERPAAGVRSSTPGTVQRIEAPVGEARPSVVQARVAVPALDRDRASDDVESAQEVSTTIRALVHASSAGGVAGDQWGGSGGGGAAAAGGTTGATSRARALGDGDVIDYWTQDPRYQPYMRQIRRRVDPLLNNAFPKSALLELKQGTVILEFTIDASGQVVVAWPPVRSSGIDEFDRNFANAIRAAAPFPPIPRELGVSVLRIQAPFVARNPMVK